MCSTEVLTTGYYFITIQFMNTIKHHKKTSQRVDWNKAYIVAALHAAGITLRQLSAKHGYKATTLSHALHRPYAKAEKIIASALALSPEEIWPSRYTQAKTNPRHYKRAANLNFSTPGTGCNVNVKEGR